MTKTYKQQLEQRIEELDNVTFLQVHRELKEVINKMKIAQASINNQCDIITATYCAGIIEDLKATHENYIERITYSDLWRGEHGEEHQELSEEELNSEVF
ncbi:hypothetical protein ACMGE9_02615 [Macrococcus sp. EM39E]|uniref:hypothetical protein n=1 Tax=Macrococcus animalis TaxID=3395467 RepID=UPI0039BE9E52